MKRFVSLSTAIMLGTVLAKDHGHVAKMVTKVEKQKNKEGLVPKRQDEDSLEEYRVKIEKWENQGGKFRNSNESPLTSKETEKQNQASDISPASLVVDGPPYCRRKWKQNAYNYRRRRWEMATICEHCSADGQCKNEWKNRYEKDGSRDNSRWTSIQTDGLIQTSPSVDQRPIPRPLPGPRPGPGPRPNPIPVPKPRPGPQPRPNPIPVPKPRPGPQPRPNPIPVPKPRPGPRPGPGPRPRPGPKPLPWNYCRRTWKQNAFNYRSRRWELATICEHCSANGQCKHEWKNCYEKDGSPDNSRWTSIQTDGRNKTSPSVNLEVEETLLLKDKQDPDKVICVSCKFDESKNMKICFNGIARVPETECDEIDDGSG